MDLPLCIASTILFSSAFQTLTDTTSLILTNGGYSSTQISFIILIRVVGKVFAGLFFKRIIKKIGVFKSVVAAMIIFCEAVCIFWFANSIGYISILTFLTSVIFNYIILNMNSAIRSYGNSKLLVTYYSVPQIFSSLILNFEVFEKIILILSIGLLSLGCFLFRDLNKAQADTNEKGEGAMVKVYFKYEKYFFASLIYSLSFWLINKYLLLSLISMNVPKTQITEIFVFLPLGRLCLNYVVCKVLSRFSPEKKIIFCSFWAIISTSLFAYTLHLKNWVFFLSVFLCGVFLNCKLFVFEYFIKNRQPQDYNISLQITDQQIDSLSQFLVTILGSFLSYWNASGGVFITTMILHAIVIFIFI